MKIKTIFPRWFSPYCRPTRPLKPSEFFEKYKREETIYHGEGVFQISEPCLLEVELDSSSCYYESDRPTIKVFKVSRVLEKNTRYETDLKRYERQNEVYKKNEKEWKVLKEKWDENERVKKENKERKLLENLKKKYES